MLSVIGDDRNRLPIIAYEHTGHEWTTLGLKSYTVPDLELKHPFMGAHLAQEAKAFHDSMIEVDQFSFG